MNNHNNAEQRQAASRELLSTFIHELNITRRHLQTYPTGHPIIAKGIENVLQRLTPLFRQYPSISLGVAKNSLLFEHQWFKQEDARVRDFALALSKRDIAAVHFTTKPSRSELLKFAAFLNLDQQDVEGRGGIGPLLESLQLTQIKLTPVDYSAFRTTENEPQASGQQAATLWEDFLSRLLEGSLTDKQHQKLATLSPQAIAEILNKNYVLTDSPLAQNHEQAIADFIARAHATENQLKPAGQQFGLLIEQLSPKLRSQFINSTFRHLDNNPAISEESLQTLTGPLLNMALQQLEQKQLQLSSNMLNLIGKLGQSYAPNPQHLNSTIDITPDELGSRLKILFREEEKDKFTPESYQVTLDEITLQNHHFQLDPKQAKRLRKQLLSSSMEKHNCAIIFNLLEQEKLQPESEDGLENNLVELAQFFLATGDFNALGYLQQRLGRFLQQHPDKGPARTSHLQQRLNGSEFNREVLDNLSRWDEQKQQEIRAYIKIAGNSIAEPLIERLSVEEDKTLRRTYLNTLASLGKAAHDAIYQMLRDERWYVVRNLLTALKMQDDPLDLKKISHLEKHSHLRVNQEYLQLLFKFDRNRADLLLTKLLKSKDPQLLMHAVQLAEQSRDPATVQQLLALLNAEKLTDETLPLKQQIVKSLCASGAENAFPTLQKLLNPGLLFTSKRSLELQKEIVRHLDKLPAQQVTPLLRKLANSRRKELNSLAAEKLRQLVRETDMKNTQNTELLNFIRRVTTAAATASLYQLKHQQVEHLCQQAKSHLRQLLREKTEITLMLIDGRLIFADKPLKNDFSVDRLVKFFQQRGIAHLSILQGITDVELLKLVEQISQKNFSQDKIAATEHVRYGQITLEGNKGETLDQLVQQLPTLEEIATEEIDRFSEIYEAIKAGKQLHVRGLNEIVGSFVQAFSEQGNSLLALAPLRNVDEYTYTHSTNVCILNIAQAKMLGIEGQLLYEIGISAMLHDIGKLFVPPEILQKEGSLNEEEWAFIRRHPEMGAEYLANTPGIPRLAVITAYEHHIRYDSSGYPQVAKGWPQHLCSQMTTISDFFDALRTHRSYRAGMDFEKIASIMLEEAGTTLHPQLTHNFLNSIRQLNQLQAS